MSATASLHSRLKYGFLETVPRRRLERLGGGTDLCFFMDARARAPEAPDASSFLHEGFELL
jgi:hypothetical protein